MKKKKDCETPSPEIVWNRPPRAARGPNPAHSLDGIAMAAVQIADCEGISAVSMRRIAAELGGGAASLYRYVSKKDELLDLMVDTVIAEQPLPQASGNWREDLRNIAYSSRSMTLRHPWVIELTAFRSSFGPDSLRWLEFSLQVIDGMGLDIDEMLVMVQTLFSFVHGYVAGEIVEWEAGEKSAQSREEWFDHRGHYTEDIFRGDGEFPMVWRVAKDGARPHDPKMAEKGFAQGLEHVLDGFAVCFAKRSAELQN